MRNIIRFVEWPNQRQHKERQPTNNKGTNDDTQGSAGLPFTLPSPLLAPITNADPIVTRPQHSDRFLQYIPRRTLSALTSRIALWAILAL